MSLNMKKSWAEGTNERKIQNLHNKTDMDSRFINFKIDWRTRSYRYHLKSVAFIIFNLIYHFSKKLQKNWHGKWLWHQRTKRVNYHHRCPSSFYSSYFLFVLFYVLVLRLIPSRLSTIDILFWRSSSFLLPAIVHSLFALLQSCSNVIFLLSLKIV